MPPARVRLTLVVFALTAITPVAAAVAQTPPPPPADGWVVLPVDEYRTLRERTLAAPPPPPPAAAASTLSRIDYDLRPEGEALAGRALLTLDVLRDGWTRVQIPAGLMVRDATLDGARVAIVRTPSPHVLLDRAGRFVLALDVVLPVARDAGTESIALPASPAPVFRVALALPRGGIELTATGGFVADRVEDASGSGWTVFGAPNEALVLAWKRRADDRRSEAPLRVRARVTQVVGLGEDVLQVAASVRVDVVQGQLADVTLLVPAGLAVHRVDGSEVADWQLTGDRLRVGLLEPVFTAAAFVVLGEMPAAREGALDVPLLRVPAAERETGGVAVDIAGAGEMAGRTARGLDAADPADLGDIVAGRESPSMLAFRLRPLAGTEPRALSVSVVRYTPQAVLVATVDAARYRALAAEDGRLLVEATYVVRNNQRSFLKVTLPEGAILWSASVAGRPTRPGGAEARALLLPLEKGRSGEEAPTFPVTVVYLQGAPPWPDRGRVRLELPAVDLPATTLGVRLHHSPRFRVTPEPGSFRLAGDIALPATTLTSTAAAQPRAAAPADAFAPLIEQFRSANGLRSVSGALPVTVAFPQVGPSLQLAAELAPEGAAPAIEFAVRRSQ